MRNTTTAIIVVALFSLTGCRSNRESMAAAESCMETAVAESARVVSATMAAERRGEETVVVDFYAPDSSGRQPVRRISRKRTVAVRTEADTTMATSSRATTATVTATESATESRKPASAKGFALTVAIAAALTLILSTILIKRQR